jgi:predicted membrane protein (TIGR00267 family)
MVIGRLRQRMRTIMTLSETSGIARRYFALNAFDGALIGLGAIFGFYISDMHEYRVISLTILAIALGSAISGFSGAYISEKLEQEARLKRLEEAILADLKDSIHYSASLTSTIIVSLINGLSSMMAILVVSSPYVLSSYVSSSEVVGMAGSMLTFLALLGLLGYFFGRELRISTLSVVSRVLLVGVIAVVIYLLFEVAIRL